MRLSGRGVTWIGLPILILATAVSVQATPASAVTQTRYVANIGRDVGNNCLSRAHPCRTIQHAVGAARAGETVSIAAGTYDEQVSIGKTLSVVGAGIGTTRVASTRPLGATFSVGGGSSVRFVDLAISGGAGTGLHVDDSTVALVGCAVNHNSYGVYSIHGARLSIQGGTVDDNVEDGVHLLGLTSLDISKASLSNNGVPGLARFGPAFDGVLVDGGTVSIDRSTFAGNTGPGLWIMNSASVTINDSTVSGNGGAGIYETGSDMSVTHSTIASTSPDPVTTVPSAEQGGVVDHFWSHEVRPGQIRLSDTIVVAGHFALPACFGHVIDSGYNLASDDSCDFTAPGSMNSRLAYLGPLSDNGGSTLTMRPADGSRAIDAIPLGTTGCVSGTVDQRGVLRPQGPSCDIGSVEVAQN